MVFLSYSNIVSETRFETFPKMLETGFWTFIVVFSAQLYWAIFFYVVFEKMSHYICINHE